MRRIFKHYFNINFFFEGIIEIARNRFNASLRERRFYPAQWNLSDLPAYAPVPGLPAARLSFSPRGGR